MVQDLPLEELQRKMPSKAAIKKVLTGNFSSAVAGNAVGGVIGAGVYAGITKDHKEKMPNKYLEKLALKVDPHIAKATAKYLGKDLLYAGGASVAGAAAGAAIGKKVNKKNPKAGEGWGAFAGSHLAAAPISVGLAYHAMKGMAMKKVAEEKTEKHRLASFAGGAAGLGLGLKYGGKVGKSVGKTVGAIGGFPLAKTQAQHQALTHAGGQVGKFPGQIAGMFGGLKLGNKVVDKIYEKNASDSKPEKFKMPKDKPEIATKEELLERINEGLLKRDQIRADQETQVWKETKRTNDIKEKEVGKMDKMKMNADVTKEKIKAKASVSVARAKGAKK